MRPARMGAPVGVAQLVGDQRVGRFGIGNAQERFCKREQRHPFLRVQPVFVEELIDPARPLRRAQVSNQIGGTIDDALALIGRRPGAVEQRDEHFGLGRAVEPTHNGRCGIHDL